MSVRKFKVGMAAVLILGIVALFLFVGRVLAQGSALPPGEYDLEAGQYVFNVPELVETSVPPTDTPIPPTDTPVPSGHDDEAWQALTEPIGHTHGIDPNSVNDIFGEPGCWFGQCGQDLSYPWETSHENELKHVIYTWFVRRDLPVIGGSGESRDPWIKAFRIQAHFTGGAMGEDGGPASGGYMTRFHSFSLEAQVCRQFDDHCGIVRFAGHMDTGCLIIAGVENCLPGEEDAADSLRFRKHGGVEPRVRNTVLWYTKLGGHPEGPFRIIALNFDTSDSSVIVEADDIGTLHLVCPDFDCKFNNSTGNIHRVKFNILAPAFIDDDGDGLVSSSGLLNVQALYDESCTSMGPACAPYSVENAPIGGYSYAPALQLPAGEEKSLEFDTSPEGEWWIRHPN